MSVANKGVGLKLTTRGLKMIYLHVGNNKSIREKDIIGIFDMDTSTVSSITRRYLSEAERQGETESITDEIPKSFILYCEGSKRKICFSQLSSSSLYGRTDTKIQNNKIKD